MVTAAALGDALGIPVHGVCSLDAIAVDAAAGAPLLVVTDARRREVYWAAYDANGRRTDGPRVEAPAALAERADGYVTAGGMAAVLGRHVIGPESPSPAGLVRVAAADLLAGSAPGPLEPLYLRRPDAVEPAARKRVSTG
jgi:tRNA threonylcarbamoyl adenosine modification protein YeaZ